MAIEVLYNVEKSPCDAQSQVLPDCQLEITQAKTQGFCSACISTSKSKIRLEASKEEKLPGEHEKGINNIQTTFDN